MDGVVVVDMSMATPSRASEKVASIKAVVWPWRRAHTSWHAFETWPNLRCWRAWPGRRDWWMALSTTVHRPVARNTLLYEERWQRPDETVPSGRSNTSRRREAFDHRSYHGCLASAARSGEQVQMAWTAHSSYLAMLSLNLTEI